MANITTTISIGDNFSGKLNKLYMQLGGIHQQFVGLNTANLGQIGTQLNLVNQGVIKINQSAKGLGNTLGKFGEFAISLGMVKGFIDIADTLSRNRSRLSLLTESPEQTQQLTDEVFKSAQRSRGSYIKTAETVSLLGLNAPTAFANTEETVKFAELLNKQFKISGASTLMQNAATTQLVQSLGAGVLRGDEFNSVAENAPMLLDAVADFLKVPKGELRNMASEGLITGDVVKYALFNAADDINEKFKKTKITFMDVWITFSNQAIKSFEPFMDMVISFLNHPAVMGFVQFFADGITLIGGLLGSIFSIIGAILGGIADILGLANSISSLSPVLKFIYSLLTMIVAVLGTMATVIATINAVMKIWTGLQALLNFLFVTNPLGLWVTVITMIVGLIILLIDYWTGFIGIFKRDTDEANKNVTTGSITDAVKNSETTIQKLDFSKVANISPSPENSSVANGEEHSTLQDISNSQVRNTTQNVNIESTPRIEIAMTNNISSEVDLSYVYDELINRLNREIMVSPAGVYNA